MGPEYRRTLDELIARYQLEPTLRDVYVEGPSDADFLRWFLLRSELTHVVVYEIDTVYIEAADLEDARLDVGMKGRLVFLALVLGRHLGEGDVQATAVADRDLDELLGRLQQFPHLLYTDFSCLEMYLLAEEPLEKFLNVVAGGAPHTAVELCSVFGPILIELALLRAAKMSLGWNLPALRLDRFCAVDGHEILFDRNALIERSLLHGSRAGQKERLENEIERLRDVAGDNCRLVSSGHDFVGLLSWYLHRVAKVSGMRENFVHRSLLLCAEFESIRIQPMFRALVRRGVRVEAP